MRAIARSVALGCSRKSGTSAQRISRTWCRSMIGRSPLGQCSQYAIRACIRGNATSSWPRLIAVEAAASIEQREVADLRAIAGMRWLTAATSAVRFSVSRMESAKAKVIRTRAEDLWVSAAC